MYKGGSWSALKRAAGVAVPPAGPLEEKLGRALQRLLHLDDPLRLSAYLSALDRPVASEPSDIDRRLLAALHFTVMPAGAAPDTLEASLRLLHDHPAIVSELRELLPLLDERSNRITFPLDEELGWPHHVPLSVHARHSVDEILTAFGLLEVGGRIYKQKGVFRDDRTNSDLFLITLEKSERDYSPSTLYRDYAISRELFHWESQVHTSQQSPTGQRYIHHRERGGHILLFVRERRAQNGRTMPYTFLGPADYISHKGDRPIAFVWRLRRPMPAAFFRDAKVAAGS